jgi:hypothetical protein
MDAIELRRRGVELLSPVLVPYGFVYQAGEVDRGSGGVYAHGGSHERTVRWNSACAMRSVRSAIASMLPRYCTKTSPALPLGADKRDIRGSLTIRSTASATSRRIWFASGLSSSPAPFAEFAALVTKAERTRPPRGFAALSPGHHPARLGLAAPQDATGAER